MSSKQFALNLSFHRTLHWKNYLPLGWNKSSTGRMHQNDMFCRVCEPQLPKSPDANEANIKKKKGYLLVIKRISSLCCNCAINSNFANIQGSPVSFMSIQLWWRHPESSFAEHSESHLLRQNFLFTTANFPPTWLSVSEDQRNTNNLCM